MYISIVVPVYNAEKHLKECIESVIKQTNDNWELILVNDGSTDNSAEICNSYSNKYPDKIFVYHKKNEGQFLTRKLGIQKCTGDYIGFLDADDLLDKDYVECLTENIGKFNSPDTICFGFFRFDNNSSKDYHISDNTIHFKTVEERKAVCKMIVNGNMPGSLCSKVFRKSIILNNIPDEKIVKTKHFAEDAYHSFDALANSDSVLFLNQSLYRYRNNEQGFSQGFETRNPDYFNSKYLFELIQKNLPVMGIDDEETRSTLYERNFNETVYFMLKYLRSAKSTARKKEIVDFDWSSYLLEETLKQINQKNNFQNSYINVWNAFRQKKYLTIFVREKFRRIIGW